MTLLSGDSLVIMANLDFAQVICDMRYLIICVGHLIQLLSMFCQDVSGQYDDMTISVWDLIRGTEYIFRGLSLEQDYTIPTFEDENKSEGEFQSVPSDSTLSYQCNENTILCTREARWASGAGNSLVYEQSDVTQPSLIHGGWRQLSSMNKGPKDFQFSSLFFQLFPSLYFSRRP